MNNFLVLEVDFNTVVFISRGLTDVLQSFATCEKKETFGWFILVYNYLLLKC